MSGTDWGGLSLIDKVSRNLHHPKNFVCFFYRHLISEVDSAKTALIGTGKRTLALMDHAGYRVLRPEGLRVSRTHHQDNR